MVSVNKTKLVKFKHEAFEVTTPISTTNEQDDEFAIDLSRNHSCTSDIAESNDVHGIETLEHTIKGASRILMTHGAAGLELLHQDDYVSVKILSPAHVSEKTVAGDLANKAEFLYFNGREQILHFKRCSEAAKALKHLQSLRTANGLQKYNAIPHQVVEESHDHIKFGSNISNLNLELMFEIGKSHGIGIINFPSNEKAKECLATWKRLRTYQRPNVGRFRAIQFAKQTKGPNRQLRVENLDFSTTAFQLLQAVNQNGTLGRFELKNVWVPRSIPKSAPQLTCDELAQCIRDGFLSKGLETRSVSVRKEHNHTFRATVNFATITALVEAMKQQTYVNHPFKLIKTYISPRIRCQYLFYGEKLKVMGSHIEATLEKLKTQDETWQNYLEVSRGDNKITLSLTSFTSEYEATRDNIEKLCLRKAELDRYFGSRSVALNGYKPILTKQTTRQLVECAKQRGVWAEFCKSTSSVVLCGDSVMLKEVSEDLLKLVHEKWLEMCFVEVPFSRKAVKLIPKTLLRHALDAHFKYNSSENSIQIHCTDRKPLKQVTNLVKVIQAQYELNGQEQVGRNMGQVASCQVCWCDLDEPAEVYRLNNCGHSFHRDCLLFQFEDSLSASSPFPVNCPTCAKGINLSDIKHFLNEDQMDTLAWKSYRLFIDGNLNKYHWCRSPGCSSAYRNFVQDEEKSESSPSGSLKELTDRFYCRACFSSYCTRCHEIYHEGVTCKEYKKFNSHEDFAATMMRQFKNSWKDGYEVKRCPNCKVEVERLEGCDKMTCWYCKKSFCFKCATFFADTCDEVYSHMNTCKIVLTGFEEENKDQLRVEDLDGPQEAKTTPNVNTTERMEEWGA
eukprot:CAMPEP_0114991008 /NCGR_PEP_ID=MMETSP0216-20121206/11120_1 /TAXON_ID=223996 /ORGANISM="Protocruzia adherens, Strain Boccale" /LENGTH=844 /DNA_ID=CAMNT_0002354261 /DNA_START=114 /DNA_END=2647 /DNA_ORIENTATION=-